MNYINNDKKKPGFNSITDLSKSKRGVYKYWEGKFPAQLIEIDTSEFKNYNTPEQSKAKPWIFMYRWPAKKESTSKELAPYIDADRGSFSEFRMVARVGKTEYADIPLPFGKTIKIGVHVDSISEDGQGKLALAVLEKTMNGRMQAAAPTLRIGSCFRIIDGVNLKVKDIGKDAEGDFVEIIIEYPGKTAKAAKAIAQAQTRLVHENIDGNKVKEATKIDFVLETLKIEKIIKS